LQDAIEFILAEIEAGLQQALDLPPFLGIGAAVNDRGMHQQRRRCKLKLLVAQSLGVLILPQQAVGQLFQW
jgi:hypothetical protein